MRTTSSTGNVGSGKRFHGVATCGGAHRWECSWIFEAVQRFVNGCLNDESRQVITPQHCPTCAGPALSLKPRKK